MKFAKCIYVFILAHYFICLIHLIFLDYQLTFNSVIGVILFYSFLPAVMLLSLRWKEFFSGVARFYCVIFVFMKVTGLFFFDKEIEYSTTEYVVYSVDIAYFLIVGSFLFWFDFKAS